MIIDREEVPRAWQRFAQHQKPPKAKTPRLSRPRGLSKNSPAARIIDARSNRLATAMRIMGAPLDSDDGDDLQSIGSNDDDAPVSQHEEEIAFELRDDLDHAGCVLWFFFSCLFFVFLVFFLC